MLDFRLCIQEQGSYYNDGNSIQNILYGEGYIDSWWCIEVGERGKEARDDELLEGYGGAVLG